MKTMNKLVPLIVSLALPIVSYGQVTKCTLRLNVHVTPDVENPRDPGFLSTLVGNPAYSLVFISTSDEPDVQVMQLSGPPGTCSKEVEFMKQNSHIVNIEVVGGDDNGS
jgi:hypothetical protein